MSDDTVRAGRVRKKSAKVLEMEEFEKIEKKVIKIPKPKASPIKKGRKSGTSSDEMIPPIEEELAAMQEPPEIISPPPMEAKSAKLHVLQEEEHMPDMPPSKAELEAQKQASKTVKIQKTSKTPAKKTVTKSKPSIKQDDKISDSISDDVELPGDIQEDFPDSEDSNTDDVPLIADSLSLLSPANPNCENTKSKKRKRKEKKRSTDNSMDDIEVPKKKSKKKKKKEVPVEVEEEEEAELEEDDGILDDGELSEGEIQLDDMDELDDDLDQIVDDESDFDIAHDDDQPTDSDFEVEEDSLMIDTSKSDKKLTKTKKKSLSKESIEPGSSPDKQQPKYSNTNTMAMRYMTSSEKKGFVKPEKKKITKKRHAPSAYILWCSATRPKIIADHPGLDFASVSRMLADKWHSTSQKEKISWRRKAGRIANQIADNDDGFVKQSPKEHGTYMPSKTKVLTAPQFSAPAMAKMNQSTTTVATSNNSDSTMAELANATFRVTSCTPLDMAAHLKLLGESLSIIGSKLQDHPGPIAVQGSLSVLLDSMVCALAPLLCLTTQIPELNGCTSKSHSDTIDNIAYIMPGIG